MKGNKRKRIHSRNDPLHNHFTLLEYSHYSRQVIPFIPTSYTSMKACIQRSDSLLKMSASLDFTTIIDCKKCILPKKYYLHVNI